MMRMKNSKTIKSIVFGFILLFTLSINAFALTGSGTETDPYLIQDLADFDSFASDPNYWASDVHTTLACDPNLIGRTYTTAVIAPDTDNTTWEFVGVPFAGIFNGADHTIHNFTIDVTDTNNNYYLGLFGQIRSSTVVCNLRIENANITGGTYCVGGLCGSNGDWDYAGGTVTNCYFTGNVITGDDSDDVGSLVGLNCWGSVQNCHTNSFISCDDQFGGLVGWNHHGTISNCSTNSNVTGRGDAHSVGGIVGYNEYGDIINCYSVAYVTGGDGSYAVAGLVGTNDEGNISNCYAVGSVNADYATGNLVGKNNYGTIQNCYSDGSVTGKSYPIGGLVGYNYRGDIINCYANDIVTGGDSVNRLGGLVGWNEGVITNCYASGMISGGTGSSNLGGLCGYNGSGTFMACFWNIDNDPNLPGIGNASDPEVIGESTANMQKQSTFTSAGWDFVGEDGNGTNDIWRMCVDGIHYPHLFYQYSVNGDFACPDGVNTDDLVELGWNWLNSEQVDPGFSYACDPTFDGVTNLPDFAILSEHWLEGTP